MISLVTVKFSQTTQMNKYFLYVSLQTKDVFNSELNMTEKIIYFEARASTTELRKNAIYTQVPYTDSQKHESTLLHAYVLSEFLTVDHSYTKR